MSEISPSGNPPCDRALTYPEIEAAYRERSPLLKLLKRPTQSLLAVNAFTLWLLALVAIIFALGFHYYGWGKRSSVGSSRFELRVTVPPALESLDQQDTEVMHTGAMDLGGVVYCVAILLSLLGLVLAAVALLFPKRRRRLAVMALTLNFLLLYCLVVIFP